MKATLRPLLCVCGQILNPKKGFLWTARSFSCSTCSFTLRLATSVPESPTECLAKAEKLVDEKGQDSWQTAVTYTSIALAKTPDSLPCRWIRALALDKLKQYSFTIPDWTACIEGRYRAGSSAMKRGVAYQETRQYEHAIRDFDTILDGDLFPCLRSEPINQFDILMKRGRVLCDAGRFDEAAADFERVAAAQSGVAGKVPTTTSYWQLVARYRGDEERARKELLRT